MATQKLFVELSPVTKRCEPQMCVAEFTSHVLAGSVTGPTADKPDLKAPDRKGPSGKPDEGP